MKAICDFTSITSLTEAGERFRVPACFLPLMGKSFIQHIVEYIEQLGFTSMEVFVSSHADAFEELIGDGERWGTKVTYHLIRNEEKISARVAALEKSWEEKAYLFCNAVYLPLIQKEHLKEPCRITDSDLEPAGDTGWVYGSLADYQKTSGLAQQKVQTYHITSAEDYLETLKKAFNTNGEGLIFLGKRMKEGIWLGPGTSISSRSTLVPPVYINSKVSISDGAIVGPNVELGSGTVVDNDSYITDSSILEGSYIGKNLDIRKSIINQNQILRADLNSIYGATDQIILSPVAFKQTVKQKPSVSILSRLVALIFGLLTLPLLILLRLISGKPQKIMIVPIPQNLPSGSMQSLKLKEMTILKSRKETDGPLLHHLIWRIIPGFWRVAAGKARFFGIPFKRAEEVENLDKDWKGIYLQSIPGLISEADILYRTYPDESMLFASEMLYRVNESRKYNVKLAFRYIQALFLGREDSR